VFLALWFLAIDGLVLLHLLKMMAVKETAYAKHKQRSWLTDSVNKWI